MTFTRPTACPWVLLLALATCGPAPGAGSTGSTGLATTGASTGPASTTALSVTEAGPTSATTGGEPATTSTTGTSTSDGVDFLARPDAGVLVVECDPHAEMPCPDGQKCSAAAVDYNEVFIYTGTPSCFPILGDIQKGEPCELGEGPADGLDECAPGLVCVDVHWSWGTTGICVDFCNPPTYTLEHQVCSDPKDFCYNPGCQECPLSVCFAACDPLVQDCPDGTACVAQYNAFSCMVLPPDLPAVGEACESYECAAGAECALSEELANPSCEGFETCCTPFCDLNAPNTCPGAAMGEVCKPYFPGPSDPVLDPWSVQYDRLGVCGIE